MKGEEKQKRVSIWKKAFALDMIGNAGNSFSFQVFHVHQLKEVEPR